MSKKKVLLIGVLALLILSLFATLVTGEQIKDKLSKVIRLKLGLDSGIYRVIETEYQDEKVILVAIFGDEKAQDSSLGKDIKSGLRKYEEKTPVAISILSRNKDVQFHPYALRVIQNGESGRAKDIIGITENFKDGDLPERVPIEGKVFWGSKGIITLGEAFDPATPFKIKYGTTGASFNLPSVKEPGPEKASEKEEDIDVKKEGSDDQGLTPGEPSDGSRGNSTPPASSKSGQGFALLAQFGTLLAITLSLL